MAILVPTKKTRILSAYAGQSSRIVNIEKIKSDKVIIRNGVETTEPAPDRKSITYEVFFNIDLRKLIESNIQYLDFSILLSPVKKRAGMFVELESRAASDVMAALYGGTSESYEALKYDKKTKTLGAGKIDLISHIRHAGTNSRNFNKKSDIELFGKKAKISLVDPASEKRKNKGSQRLAIKTSSTFNPDNVSNREFFDIYREIISLGADPSSAFFSVSSLSSPSPKIPAYKQNIENLYPKNIPHKNIDTMRSKFETLSLSNISDINSLPGNSTGRVAVMEKKSGRIKTIRHVFKIFADTISSLESFYFSVTAKDPESGLTTEMFEFSIPHTINIENYYIPESLPNISILRKSMNSNYSYVNCIIGNIDKKISSIDLSMRKISDDTSLASSKFSPTSEITSFKEIKDQKCYRLSKITDMSKSQMVIIRSIPKTVAGLKIMNINGDSICGEMFNYVHSGIYTSNQKNAVFISYFVDSDDVAGVTVYRKIKGETEYTPMLYTNQTSFSIGGEPEVVVLNSEKSEVARNGRVGNTVDPIGNPGKLIDYRLRLFFKNGADQFSRQSSSIVRVDPLNAIDVNIGEIYRSRDKNGSIAVGFKIGYTVVETNTDVVYNTLQASGMASLFSDTIVATRGSLSDMVVFGVKRVNITTSEVDFFGYHQAGDFVDGGSIITPPQVGNKYRYYVNAYLASPEQIKNYFEMSQTYNSNIINSLSQIRIPTYIQRVQNSAIYSTLAARSPPSAGPSALSSESIEQFNNFKIQKYFSGKALASGKIENSVNATQDYDFEKYNTGDFSFKNLNISLGSYDIISSSRVSLTRSNEGSPVLRFKVTSSEPTSLDLIDYIIITCVKNGQSFICGACHCDQTGKIVFIDYTNKEFIGTISYFASIVMVGGNVISKKTITSSTLLENKPMNIDYKIPNQGK